VVALGRELGDSGSVALGLLNLSMVATCRGAVDDARERLQQALTIAEETGSKSAGQSVLEVSAGLAAACLRLRGMTAFVLWSYVIAYAALIVITAALSAMHLVGRWGLMSGVATSLAGALGVWLRCGRPRGPSLTGSVSVIHTAKRDQVTVLAVGVGLALLYITAVALFTAPNSVDALWYHLSRAAFWKQQQAVGYIANANDERLNGSPPVGEMAILYTMAVSRTDRFVTIVALGGYVALIVGVFGIARRLGFESREALFAALLFATLPVVTLQASGALNDLVIGSFLVICVYFCLGIGSSRPRWRFCR
jgi:hypothetical protein